MRRCLANVVVDCHKASSSVTKCGKAQTKPMTLYDGNPLPFNLFWGGPFMERAFIVQSATSQLVFMMQPLRLPDGSKLICRKYMYVQYVC